MHQNKIYNINDHQAQASISASLVSQNYNGKNQTNPYGPNFVQN